MKTLKWNDLTAKVKSKGNKSLKLDVGKQKRRGTLDISQGRKKNQTLNISQESIGRRSGGK